MLKFRWRSTTKTTDHAPTTGTAPITGADVSRDPNHPLHIRNLLDYPQLQAVMGNSPEPATAASISSIDGARFNRRHLLEGAA